MALCVECQHEDSGNGSGQSKATGVCANCRFGREAAAGSTDESRRATNAVADQRKGRRGRRSGDGR
jgi:hypothetical protein